MNTRERILQELGKQVRIADLTNTIMEWQLSLFAQLSDPKSTLFPSHLKEVDRQPIKLLFQLKTTTKDNLNDRVDYFFGDNSAAQQQLGYRLKNLATLQDRLRLLAPESPAIGPFV